MAAPIEFRYYLRPFALADLQAGAQPLRVNGGMFAPPVLQYRYRERGPEGAATWCEWQTVPVVAEGADAFDLGPLATPANVVHQ